MLICNVPVHLSLLHHQPLWLLLSKQFKMTSIILNCLLNNYHKKKVTQKKVLMILFWNMHAILLMKFVPAGSTVTATIYTNISTKLPQVSGCCMTMYCHILRLLFVTDLYSLAKRYSRTHCTIQIWLLCTFICLGHSKDSWAANDSDQIPKWNWSCASDHMTRKLNFMNKIC